MSDQLPNAPILTQGVELALRGLVDQDKIRGRKMSHVSWNIPPSFTDWVDFIRSECRATHSSQCNMAIKLERPLIWLRISIGGQHTFPDFVIAGILRDLYSTGEWQVVYDKGATSDKNTL